MSVQLYNTANARTRNQYNVVAQFLKHAEPLIVMGAFGMQKDQPLNRTDSVSFRRANPYNMQANGAPSVSAAALMLQEGTTPTPGTMTFTDVTTTLNAYGILLKISSKTELMHEDDIPQEMAMHVAETGAELSEVIRYGALKGGTNVYYANGTARNQVNTAPSLPKLRNIAKALANARAKRVTSKLAPGADYGTVAVNPAYIVFISTDLDPDYRNMPGFKDVVDYAAQTSVHPAEIGSVEYFRILPSPIFQPWLGAGNSTLNSMTSVGGSAVDVYPSIVMAQDAWGQVALKGRRAFDPTILPASQKSHANPLGQFGYVGGSFWTSVVRLNENWMARLESGATAL